MSKLKKEWFIDGRLVPPASSILTEEALSEALTRFQAMRQEEGRDKPDEPPRERFLTDAEAEYVRQLLPKK